VRKLSADLAHYLSGVSYDTGAAEAKAGLELKIRNAGASNPAVLHHNPFRA
jgi:hypothetical protein